MDKPIQVVAGIVRDASGRVLLAQRLPGKHLAGLWEFPGGKCKDREAPVVALKRELLEELGIEIGAVDRLISFPWHYPEKTIVLDVYDVLNFRGDACGLEGQALRWLAVDSLNSMPMPDADRPVVAALKLPRILAISPDIETDVPAFLRQLQLQFAGGIQFAQLRCNSLAKTELIELARIARILSSDAGARFVINGNLEIAEQLDLDGVHLPAAQLMRTQMRPLGIDRWVGASCHDARELAHAADIGVDYATLGPVMPTTTHPDQAALGWEKFAELTAGAAFPVYALGGMKMSDVAVARQHGGHGVAGISAFWPH